MRSSACFSQYAAGPLHGTQAKHILTGMEHPKMGQRGALCGAKGWQQRVLDTLLAVLHKDRFWENQEFYAHLPGY